ncbi:gliding motility-associated C-terminal domain-containing protein [bacterium]|nr:gliding motility-associated C-terminal domain-containing protein [bacterium]
MRRFATYVPFVLFLTTLTLSAQLKGDYEKTFDSFMFSMTSDITITDNGDVTAVGVRLDDIRLTYDEAEDAYLGEGDLVHTNFEIPLGDDCWIAQPIYRTDRYFIRVEVDEYFDAAPDVRLFIRMRGTTAFTMAGEGAIINCLLQDGDTLDFTQPAVPIWAAGWFVIRDDVGEGPSEPHGWPIKNLKVEGWEITGIEREDFRIHKELDHSFTDDDGGVFREKATYVIEPCLKHEVAFEMGVDSYTFTNLPDVVWPESYWSQFDYSVEGDAFLTVTGNPPASIFPDWYAFSRAFGEAQTYRSVFPKVHVPKAMLRWNVMNRPFGGSCYGFAYSSLLHYTGLRSAVPQPLGNLTPEDIVLEELHEKHCYQMSAEAIQNIFQNYQMRPKQMVEKLIENFKEDGTANCALSVILGGEGHTMVPLRVIRCFDDENDEVLTRIEVWDNYSPFVPRTIEVNETQNVILGSNGNVDRGFFPDVPATAFAATYPTMYKAHANEVPGGSTSKGAKPTLLASNRTEVFYKGGGTAMLAVDGRDPVDLNHIDLDAPEDMHPIHLTTGTVPIVPGYTLDTQLASTVAVDVTTGGERENITSINPPGALNMMYSAGAGSSVRAVLRNDDLGMDVSTQGSVHESVLQLLRSGEEHDILVHFSEIDFSGSDGVTVEMGENEHVAMLRNQGGTKTFAVEVMRFGETFSTSSTFTGIEIADDETQTVVVGSVDSLRTTQIELHVDRGSDGSTDEIRVLRAYGTVSVDRPAVISEDLHAWPSPWNPALQPLQLRYALQRPATARLVVYNTLQQEVVELVAAQPHQASSLYTASWDGLDSKGRPVPGGSYFYILQTEDGSRALGKLAIFR